MEKTMKTFTPERVSIAATSIILLLAAVGCTTKKYVGKQIDSVNQRVAHVQAQTNEQLAKQQREISHLDERQTTTENKLATVAAATQQAGDTAGQALQQSQTNASAIQTNATDISAQSATLVKLENNFNYSLLESGNVTFGFNKWELSKDAKAALDLMVEKAAGSPRPMIEVVGYTDKVGSKSYNLTLSRRRADAVARYLVENKVPLKSISLIGLGEEQTPELLAAEVQGLDPNASPKELRGLARRVRIRLYVPGDGSSAAGSSASASGDIQK
jgi:outer membrane protein OmpA-like peptidoglycan-associated protein